MFHEPAGVSRSAYLIAEVDTIRLQLAEVDDRLAEDLN